MLSVIHRLMRPGGLEVARHFRLARGFWTKFLKDHRKDDIATLAKAISGAQSSYRLTVKSDNSFAKETMAVTCLAALYDEAAGWTPRKAKLATRLAKAFAKSTVSTEVKFGMREAVRLYGLDERDGELSKPSFNWFSGNSFGGADEKGEAKT